LKAKRQDCLWCRGQVIIGEEYPAEGAGVIDILARDKKTKDWVVIELKKGQTSDLVIAQPLRYMGLFEVDSKKPRPLIIINSSQLCT
jgi:RecB family endonuclease NucS